MGYFFLFILFLVIIFCITGLYTAFNIGRNKKKHDYDILDYSYSWHDPDYQAKIKQWIKTVPLNYIKIKSAYHYKINILNIKNNDKSKWILFFME